MASLPCVFTLLLTLSLSFPLFGQETALSDEQLASIQLPMDPEDPVFEYDSSGGLRKAVPQDFASTPKLRVFSDGKIVAGGHNPLIKTCSRVLSEAELNQFLHFVVNKCGFYDLNTIKLKNRMADTGKELFVVDAPTSKFLVNLQRGSNSVEIYGLTFAARTFNELDEIQNLLEIQEKCQKLIAFCHLGSEQQASDLLANINEQLTALHPELPGFEAKDVRFATRFTDGQFQGAFQKSYPATETSPTINIDVRVRQAGPGQSYEIKISEVNNKRSLR